MIVNCYSSGNIKGTNAGGIIGKLLKNENVTVFINCYYLKSNTVNNSIGGTEITKVTQADLIEPLNKYIEDNEHGYVTIDWKTWALDKNGNPILVDEDGNPIFVEKSK